MPLGLKSFKPSPLRGAHSRVPRSGRAGGAVRVEREAACSAGMGGGPSSLIS